MDRGSYRCGFLHPGVECFIAQISKLLTNYGCDAIQASGYIYTNINGADGDRMWSLMPDLGSAVSDF